MSDGSYDTKVHLNQGGDTLEVESGGTILIDSGGVLKVNGTDITASAALVAAGVAAGYKIARGVAAVTGTGTVVTGLATVVAVVATPQTDPDGVTLAMVSATIGDQAGSPAAGSVILKAWKVTATGNATLIAATAAASINWVAVGT